MKEVLDKKPFMIAKLFDEICEKYDFINTLLSFGLDKRWRAKVLKFIPKNKVENILDIACGSCEQIISIAKKRPLCRFTGIDISEKLLSIGKEKLSKKNYNIEELIHGSALDLPFICEKFDKITISFGIRNMENTDKALQEAFGVLKKNGKLFILEFSVPQGVLQKKMALFYLKYILPKAGNLLSKHSYAYTYLNESIVTFPSGDTFIESIKRAGFTHAKCYLMTFGMVTLYVGEKT